MERQVPLADFKRNNHRQMALDIGDLKKKFCPGVSAAEVETRYMKTLETMFGKATVIEHLLIFVKKECARFFEEKTKRSLGHGADGPLAEPIRPS